MEPVSVGTVFKLLDELRNALSGNSPLKRQVEMLNEEVKLLHRHITSLERENASLTKQLADVTKDLADLRELYAAAQLTTDEFEKGGYVYRRTKDGVESGPYCPYHRDVRLVPVGGHMFCNKCRLPIQRG